MLGILKDKIKKIKRLEDKINFLREYLQILILKIIYDSGEFKHLAFVGGTALRLLYDLNRFSEDLDFSVVDKKNYRFRRLCNKITSQLKDYGFKLSLKMEDKENVQYIMVGFENILYDFALSNIKSQKLKIKIEVDANPPGGFNTEVSLINKEFIFTITHFNLASLYATKLHACFYRKYTKGRDFYDLLWYITKKVKPNYKLLCNAIKQTEHREVKIKESNFKQFLIKKLSEIDFIKIRKDIERFLINKEELKLLDKNLIIKQINGPTFDSSRFV